jgi:hypothetical protein
VQQTERDLRQNDVNNRALGGRLLPADATGSVDRTMLDTTVWHRGATTSRAQSDKQPRAALSRSSRPRSRRRVVS